MKRILISLILLSVLVVLPAYGTEIVNGVEQGLGGDTYDGTGVDTIVAGTSIAVPSQLTATTTGVSLGTATATSLAVPSGFTATTAGAQAKEFTVVTDLHLNGSVYHTNAAADILNWYMAANGRIRFYKGADIVAEIGPGSGSGLAGVTAGVSSGNPQLLFEVATATNPTVIPYALNATTGLGGDSDGKLYAITGGATAMTYSYAAAGPSIGLGKNMSIILASGSGPFMGYSATALSPMPYSGTAGFYAADSGGGTVKMYAADDAGGTAALTPHANYEDWDLMAPETDNPYPFLQGPFQQRALGVEVVYDVERMAIAMAAFADGKPCPYPPGTKFVHWRKLPDDKQIDLKELKKKAWKNNWIKDNTTDEVIPTDEQSEAAAISGFTFSNPAGINLDWEAK